MRALGNILWYLPFFGFITAFIMLIIGTILTVLVVTAPIGLGLIEYGKFLFFPFSYELIKKSDTDIEQNKYWKLYGNILKVLYVPFIGLPLFVLGLIQVVGLAITIIGIPPAIVIAKSLRTTLQPVGKICVPRLVAKAIEQNKAEAQINKYVSTENK